MRKMGNWLVGVGVVLLLGGFGAGTAAGGVPPDYIFADGFDGHPNAAPLSVPLTVKEVAGVGADQYPVLAVVPLQYGSYYTDNLEHFHVVDSGGNVVASQVSVHNLWWARDQSIRMLDVQFEPTVAPYTTGETGQATYYLVYDPALSDPATPLSVSEANGIVTVVTGPLKFITSRDSFRILDKVWLDKNNDGAFSADELLLDAATEGGGMLTNRFGNPESDAARADVTLEVEQSGPIRVVLRAESLSKFHSTTDMRSGFAVRIYAYANKPFLKIDYQLQNAALNSAKSWPLYFQSLNLDFPLTVGSSPMVTVGLGAGNVYTTTPSAPISLQQDYLDNGASQGELQFEVVEGASVAGSGTKAPGYLDVTGSRGGVTAVTRFFWQMWPNGLAFDPTSGTMQVQLFPDWGRMWVQRANDPPPHFSASGLYWLQDMQAVYKEVLLDFHDASAPIVSELEATAATFHHAPVPMIHTAWYAATQATLDMSGLIPFTTQQGAGGPRQDEYGPYAHDDSKGTHYNFGWDQFLANVTRKWGTESAGGWPHAVARDIILTGNPAAYYYASEFAMGELNMHPQWMPGYSYEDDYSRVPVTPSAHYNEFSWRQTGGLAAPPLAGTTDNTARPRGDEHGWFYQTAQAYNFNASLWIKDWYEFIGEMRMARLHDRGAQDSTDRGRGHAFANALQAFRATGDMDIIQQSQWFVQLMRSWQSPRYGVMHGGAAKSGQIGFLARAIISYMAEVKNHNAEGWAQGFQLVSGIIEWNRIWGNFGYSVDASNDEHGSSGITGQNMANPQAWYYLHTGRDMYRDQLLQFIETGINGGCAALDCAGAVADWTRDGKGGYVGRTSTWVYQHAKTDGTPAGPITDLSATRIGNGDVEVTFTVPNGDATRYHFVYGKKPISATTTTDTAYLNWWAAHVRAPAIAAAPGQQASFVFHTDIADSIHMALFSFDDHDNLSEMSNLYTVAGSIRNEDGLISPWQFDNVGSPPPAGSASYAVASNIYDTGVYTIHSQGSFNSSSATFAYVHQPASSDKTIVARIDRNTFFTQAGLMFRESLTSASHYVALFYTNNGLHLVYRGSAGGENVYLGQSGEPGYLKLERNGDTYTAYASADGTDWGQPLASVTVPGLPVGVQAGIAVGSSSTDGVGYPAEVGASHLSVE